MLGLNGLKMHYFLFGHKVNGLNLMGRLRTCVKAVFSNSATFFSSQKLLEPMFVDFKFSTFKIQVSDYLDPKENSVFQFSVANFLSVKPGVTKHVCLCEWGISR